MIHLDTSFLIRALIPGTREESKLRRWVGDGEALAMSSVAWAEFLCGPPVQRVGSQAHDDYRLHDRSGSSCGWRAYRDIERSPLQEVRGCRAEDGVDEPLLIDTPRAWLAIFFRPACTFLLTAVFEAGGPGCGPASGMPLGRPWPAAGDLPAPGRTTKPQAARSARLGPYKLLKKRGL